ncbi:MAG: C69 family dipeptidase [Candidatus Marinimicrobia bacterium]|jgi:secernin|nr:C69 family dipeptidase [Candidatus Neomarinimicrobiota bacterium]
MCDTIIIPAEVSPDGTTIFAKNSDREPNEAQSIVRIPAQDHSENENLKCTYIKIPQVKHTNTIVISQPFWIWGAEMGVNEYGVAIGNEAVFTKIKYEKSKSLIGMDLLRLGLERAKTSREAVLVITKMLEKYGQSGDCGFKHKMYYHNSFIIADPQNTWVLETAGKHWVAKKIKDVYSISNCLIIHNNWDLISADLVNFAIKKGWCKSEDDFDFANSFSDHLFTKFSDSHNRRNRTMELLKSKKHNIMIKDIFSILRDHKNNGSNNWRPDEKISGANVCMHASFGPIRISQTVSSFISYLYPDNPLIFATGTAAPCTGIFKPVWTDVELPNMGQKPTGVYDNTSLFWQHEILHRNILNDHQTFVSLFKSKRNDLEEKFLNSALSNLQSSRAERKKITDRCFKESEKAENDWLKLIKKSKIKKQQKLLHKLAWKKFNKQAQIRL